MNLQVGDIIERYQVESLLGRGAMAEVYRVRHRTLKTAHALKVLMLASARIRERLIVEGQVQAQMRHPNVLAVTDVLDVHGAPGLLMEFVDGPSLDAFIEQTPPDAAQALHLFRGILAGVAEAHAAGLVHRDLKPANVLVATTARGLVPKVADFGLAKLLMEEEGAAAHRTRSGSAMGTPAYMAPEQIRSARHVDHRADIFSLGCILYELMSGRRPFDGDDLLGIFNAVAAGRYEPLRDVPDAVQLAIQGALEVDRERRIPSCAVMQEVLDGQRTTWQQGELADSAPADLAGVAASRVAARPGAVSSGTWSDDEPEVVEEPRPPQRPQESPAAALGVELVETPRVASRPTLAPPPNETLPPLDSMMSIGDAVVASPTLVEAEAAPPPRQPEPRAAYWRGWAIGLGVVVAIGSAAAVYWPEPSPELAPAEPAATPEPISAPASPSSPSSGATEVPSPVADPSTSSAPSPAPPPQVAAAPAVPAPERAAPVTKKPATSPAPARPEVAAPAGATAPLVVTCAGAAVSIDGKAEPKRGMARRDVSVGRHTVTCAGSAGEITRTVEVREGEGGYFCWDFDLGSTCN